MTAPLVDHALLPDIAGAPLPATYEAAKRALAQCEDLDECRDWADKAEALASYARQAHDDALRRMCDRIQARAIRRCGELLQQIEPATGAHLKSVGADTLSRKQAARDAGLSDRQRVTALRVAKVPDAEFEAAIERDDPATVTALAEQGTAKRIDHLNGRDPGDFERATRLLGLGTFIMDRIGSLDVDAAIRGLNPRERGDLISTFGVCIAWLAATRERMINGI